MTSAALGTPASEIEVTNVSPHGLWLLLRDEELFLPFADFPWFKDAPVGKHFRVEILSPNHLYWPELDIDLSVDSIRRPERFPLMSRHPG